jgi:uncharacterized protein YbjT (DUF2867 family)
MATTDKVILVTGATGNQGGAVARHLLAHGWKVRAMNRDNSKPAAQELRRSGAELVQGSLESRQDLDNAMRGVYGVFSTQQFWEHGADGEVRQGKLVADAAKAAGVKHLIYSSVGSAERNTGISHFDSKREIELYIKSLGIPNTILRPVFFMDNFRFFSVPTLRDGVVEFSIPLAPTYRLLMVAVDDVGVFATMAFEHPEQWIGKEVELAGDAPSMEEVATTYTKVTGKPARFVRQPIEQVRAFSDDAAVMYEWFERDGYRADISALRRMHPGLKTFEQWMREVGIGAVRPV